MFENQSFSFWNFFLETMRFTRVLRRLPPPFFPGEKAMGKPVGRHVKNVTIPFDAVFYSWVSTLPTNTVVRSFFGQAMLCSFCSPETQHFQKNNSFSFFSAKNLEINDTKVVLLWNYRNIFGSPTLIEIFWWKKWKTIICWKCLVSGLQNEHIFACLKHDLTTVFVGKVLTQL